MPDRAAFRLHQDPALFREAVSFTASETGFIPRLIEKDYFCTVLLEYLTTAGVELIFKGGTCLAKVHLGFYRLSEDLDFVIPTRVDASRSQRRRLAEPSKRVVEDIVERMPPMRIITRLAGANDSTLYAAVIGYDSLLGAREETIKIEIGLREPLLLSALRAEARTLLLDPIAGAPMIPAFLVPCLSLEEAMAEKLRAALSRREPAICDFYDIDHAVRRCGVRIHDPALIALLRQKLAVPGNEPIDVSPVRLAALELQLASQLKPVLRNRDFAEFDLERTFVAVADLAAVLD